jgi:lysine decarboxylase/arginine decarboxylase
MRRGGAATRIAGSPGEVNMKTLGKQSWPVLFVSDQMQLETDEGSWLRDIVKVLTEVNGCRATFCSAYGDAHDIVYSSEDLGTIVVDWEIRNLGRLHKKNAGLEVGHSGARLVDYIRQRNASIPILVLSDRASIESIPNPVLERINGVLWKLTDTPEFNAGRIERCLVDYMRSVLPPFFRSLVEYVYEYNFAWHTPGHMGGQGFLKSPSGTAFHRFFGENMLRADLSISVPELGSLLDHSGVTGEAEAFSARVFGADETYYVLNGTSTGNQVVWRSQVSPGEACLLDRNCHKSLSHAMVVTGAVPDYMVPIRNALGIIGPVDFGRIDAGKRYAMAALTNSTYDGICYDAGHAKRMLAGAAILHFDEAWYAYAKFHPIYAGHFGMGLKERDRLVFCTQSTHKLLTALSQASMIHVKFPEEVFASEEARDDFHDTFNESYMMHCSTSPQYSMVASLEVATKMMHDNGPTALADIMEEAIELRRKIARIKAEEAADGDWFFGIWQPEGIMVKSTEELIGDQRQWVLEPGAAWHGFSPSELTGDYAMLDPVKLTFLCPGVDVAGSWAERGIPAAIVTRYLGDKGIVCEKTDYYSWLLLNSLGTTKGKQGTLVAELFRFRELYNANAPLDAVFPLLVHEHPGRYKGMGLADHCQEMHAYIRGHGLLESMVASSRVIPDRSLVPAEAYRAIVKKEVEFVRIDGLDPEASPRTSAVMVVPYPPGIPILMGGEVLNARARPILDYLRAREAFENSFPGYEGEIHGIDRSPPDRDGLRHFEIMVVKGP